MKKRNCTHSLLGTDALQNHGVPSPYWVLFPVPTGYTMILIHICSQQELGTDAWSTLSLLGTEYILVHISTQSLLGTVPSPYWVLNDSNSHALYPVPAGYNHSKLNKTNHSKLNNQTPRPRPPKKPTKKTKFILNTANK